MRLVVELAHGIASYDAEDEDRAWVTYLEQGLKMWLRDWNDGDGEGILLASKTVQP